MSPLERFLARPSNPWSVAEREEAWKGLVAILDALPEGERRAALVQTNVLLARAYQDAGTTAVYLEDDQRIAPRHWCLPAPSQSLVVAREVNLDASEVEGSALLALAESPSTGFIRRVVLRQGALEKVLPRLLRSPLLHGVEMLDLRESQIGGPDGAARLARSRALRSLAVLDLSFCGIADEGVEALLASPHLQQLEILVVEANCVDPYGEKGPDFWPELNARLEARGLVIEFV